MTIQRTIFEPLESHIEQCSSVEQRLEAISEDIQAHTAQVRKREALNDKLAGIRQQKLEKNEAIDSLRDDFTEASFTGNDEWIHEIHDRRKTLLADLENLKLEEEEVSDELAATPVDGQGIGEIVAVLEAGIKLPYYRGVLQDVENALKTLHSEQEARLREVRSSVPSEYMNRKAYEAQRKRLDSRYRTSEESKKAAERYAAEREAERRRYNQSKSPEEIALQNRKNEKRAMSAPVEATHQW